MRTGSELCFSVVCCLVLQEQNKFLYCCFGYKEESDLSLPVRMGYVFLKIDIVVSFSECPRLADGAWFSITSVLCSSYSTYCCCFLLSVVHSSILSCLPCINFVGPSGFTEIEEQQTSFNLCWMIFWVDGGQMGTERPRMLCCKDMGRRLNSCCDLRVDPALNRRLHQGLPEVSFTFFLRPQDTVNHFFFFFIFAVYRHFLKAI